MYKCKNCKFFDKISSEDYGTCIAWGYGKSCHSTYSHKQACNAYEKGDSSYYGRNRISKKF